MWDWLLIIAGVIIVLCLSKATTQEGFELPAYNPPVRPDISAYYQQRSHYPTGAWWIPYYDPAQKCHLKARVECHDQFCFDNCYEHVLKNCQPPPEKPWGLVPYKVNTLNPAECPRSPPYPEYLNGGQ